MNNIMLFNDPKVKKFIDMIKMVEFWTVDNNLAISHTMMRLMSIIKMHRPDHSRLDLKDFLDNEDNMEMICEVLTYTNIEYTCHFFNLIDETFPGTSLNYIIHITDRKEAECQILHERLVFFKLLELLTTIFSPTRASLISILLGSDEPPVSDEHTLDYPNNPPKRFSVSHIAQDIFNLTQSLKKQVKYRDNDDTVSTLNLIDMELLGNTQTRQQIDVNKILNLPEISEGNRKKAGKITKENNPASIATASVRRKTIIKKEDQSSGINLDKEIKNVAEKTKQEKVKRTRNSKKSDEE
jgi:hypothetical protein